MIHKNTYIQAISLDVACHEPLDKEIPLCAYNICHGSMVYARVDLGTTAELNLNVNAEDNNKDNNNQGSAEQKRGNNVKVRRTIGKDGNIVVHYEDAEEDGSKGFRKGMRALRDIKMAWTLNEFMELDSQYVFKIKAQKEAYCQGVSLDSSSCNKFQSYLRNFDFQRCRFAYLYGKFEKLDENDDNGEPLSKVIVETMYEPPQNYDSKNGEMISLDDPKEESVQMIAEALGLVKVGWIFGHPPREKGFTFSTAEVLMASELQLEAADGVNKTPFVTIKVTVNEEGEANFEAFQMSMQCIEMVAEEAIDMGPKPGYSVVNDTFTAIMEGKESKEIDNNFFLTVIPIVRHESTFVSQFPWANREYGELQTKDSMKAQLSKSGREGWEFIDLITDFGFLVYLTEFMVCLLNTLAV